MKNNWPEIIERIQLREGLDNRALAKLLGCCWATVYVWKVGKNTPSIPYQAMLLKLDGSAPPQPAASAGPATGRPRTSEATDIGRCAAALEGIDRKLDRVLSFYSMLSEHEAALRNIENEIVRLRNKV